MQLFRPLQPPIIQHDPVEMNYQYKEYLPSKPLQSYVACYWTVQFKAENSNKLHRILPDGCVDIIFDLKTPSINKSAFISELMTKYQVLDLSQNCSLFGIRFFLNTAAHFFRYPISEFKGQEVFLDDVWGNEAKFWVEDILSSTKMSEIIEKVEAKLMKFLSLNGLKTDSLLRTGLQYMVDHQGLMSIHSLSEILNYSERHISRTFKKEVGVSPKELMDIIRFQFLLKELYSSPQPHFTDVALRYGYYDQSHFIKSFKQMYGMAPSYIFITN